MDLSLDGASPSHGGGLQERMIVAVQAAGLGEPGSNSPAVVGLLVISPYGRWFFNHPANRREAKAKLPRPWVTSN